MARSTAGLVAGGLLGATVLALAGCGADLGGSVALGDGSPTPAVTTPSHDGVVFVPLDSPTTGGSATPGNGTGTTPGTTPPASTGSGTGGGAGTHGGGTHGGGAPGTPGGGTGGGTSASGGSAGSPTGTPSPPPGGGGSTGGGSGGGTGGAGGGTGGGSGGSGGGTPQTPASLAVTALHTAATGQRWCQRVVLTLANSGDRAATSGTVTFATHVIGALGVDWWTYQTSQPLAAPVAGHASAQESWTVCLDSWRVPDGMHMETRAATLS
ncbi:hypothetical protein ABH931_000120 [Streptacidiphilus sp. MAP12-33]|uniref:hypothetical protein n=1 Tax=Streptacidiphilus sp. MAP12-33 TaxID=3156266 RepID=UPI003515A67B